MHQDPNFRSQLIKRWEKGLTFTFINKKLSEEEPIELYLSEINRLVLVGKTSSKKIFFDIEKIKTEKFNIDAEIKYKLPHHQYLILRQPFEEELILIFPTVKLRNFMYDQLQQLFQILQEQSNLGDPVSIKLFLKADTDQSMSLSYPEIQGISKILKTEFETQIEEIIGYLNTKNKFGPTEYISLQNFILITQLFNSRKQVIHLYERYCPVKVENFEDYLTKSMHRNQFKAFLIRQQHENKRNAEEIMENVFKDQQYISFVTFSGYLLSPNNEALDLIYFNEHIPTDQPLTSYFCYSSHNTYLTGNQLTSDSKAERYLQDLENGLRCVEIDVHDGDHGPIVKHGFTATASVSFADVISSIAQFCDQNQKHTPIILSIENHCKANNQYQMAQIMEQALGKRIVRIIDYKDRDSEFFPTLDELIGKIIIKGSGSYEGYLQTIKKSLFSKEQAVVSYDGAQLTKQILFQATKEIPQQFQSIKKNFAKRTEILTKQKQNFENHVKKFEEFIRQSKENLTVSINKKKINSKMLLVTSMLSGGKMGSPCPWQSLSISESKLQKYFKKDRQLVRNHTDKGWVRSYPDGTRFDSSNYNPFLSIEMGIQIIALNTQNSDYYTLCLKRFFLRNSHFRKGYRYKTKHSSNYLKELQITPVSCIRLRHEEQKSIPKVQIKMCLIGESIDMELNPKLKKMKAYTETIEGNAYNPIFKSPKVMTVKSKCPQTSFVIMQVEDCGLTALPVSHIKKGYRGVKLYNKNFEYNGSKILCWIQ